MTDAPNDSVIGAAVFFYGSLAAAFLLVLITQILRDFHRAGRARLRAYTQRQERTR